MASGVGRSLGAIVSDIAIFVLKRDVKLQLTNLEPKFQGEVVVPGEYFFSFYKTRHVLLSNGADCTVLRAVVLTQYRRVTDRRTDRQTDGQTDGRTELL